jgi:hypothetical protein
MGSGPNVAHWDGTTWAQTPQVAGVARIEAIAAPSRTRAWAIGQSATPGSVLLGWNGQQWDTVALPAGVQLQAIVAIDEATAWIAGATWVGSVGTGWAQRWNGAAWKPVDLGAGAGPITSAFASSATDVWLCENEVCHHWDGASWSPVLVPYPTPARGGIPSTGATPLSMKGWAQAPGVYYFAHLGSGLYRWDGTATTEKLRPIATDADIFPAPFGTSTGDVYAPSGLATGTSSTSIMHYDGTTISHIPADATVGTVKVVWASAPDDVWGIDVKGAVLRVVSK